MLEMNLKGEFIRITGKKCLNDFGLKDAKEGGYYIFKVLKKDGESIVLTLEELGGNK